MQGKPKESEKQRKGKKKKAEKGQGEADMRSNRGGSSRNVDGGGVWTAGATWTAGACGRHGQRGRQRRVDGSGVWTAGACGKPRKPIPEEREEVRQEGATRTATRIPQSQLRPEAFIPLDSKSHHSTSCRTSWAHILLIAQQLISANRGGSSELLI